MSDNAIFYYDDFIKKDHTTVKLWWTPPKSLDGKLNAVGGGSNYRIMTGFIKTDLSIQIQNSWGNMSNFFDSFTNAVGIDVSGWIENGLGKAFQMGAQMGDAIGVDITGSKTGAALNQLSNQKTVKFSDYVKKFQGTDINFPNNIDIMFISDARGVDPRKKAREMLKFIMGGFSQDGSANVDTSKIQSNSPPPSTDENGNPVPPASNDNGFVAALDQFGVNQVEAGRKLVGGMIGFITPPGNYEYDINHDFKDPFMIMPGTLSLAIGDTARHGSRGSNKPGILIRNLLVDSAEMTVSKATTQDGFPLYVNVSLALSPSAFFSAANLDVMLGGSGNWDDYDGIDASTAELNQDSVDARKLMKSKYGHVGLPEEEYKKIPPLENIVRGIEDCAKKCFNNVNGSMPTGVKSILDMVTLKIWLIPNGDDINFRPIRERLNQIDGGVPNGTIVNLRHHVTDLLARDEISRYLYPNFKDQLNNDWNEEGARSGLRIIFDGEKAVDTIAGSRGHTFSGIRNYYQTALDTAKGRYVESKKMLEKCNEEIKNKHKPK